MRPHLDPARRCLTVDEWPEVDRMAWDQAMRTGSLLSERTSFAARWRPATRHKNRRGYGRWLTFCINSGRGIDGAPADRVTFEAIEEYLKELQGHGVALYTQRNRIGELHAAMRAICPRHDWRWLGTLVNELDQQASDAQEQPMPPILTPQIVARCSEELTAIECLLCLPFISSGVHQERRPVRRHW